VKIDDGLKKTAGLTVGTKQTGGSKAPEKAESGKTSSVNVQLSSKVQTLSAQVGSTGVFDTNKVAEIKAAIADGRFKVNAEKVADGLMDTVRDLIQSRKA